LARRYFQEMTNEMKRVDSNGRVSLEPAAVNKQRRYLLVHLYLFSQSRFAKALTIAKACFTGLWLGVLGREKLHAVDEEYYSRSKRDSSNEYNYHSKEYNRRGLWDWEERVLADYFAGCKRLLLIGAGGGREVLALQRLGYHVDGFESHPDLVLAANELLRAEGRHATVHLVPRDQSPNTVTTYDGIIVGWGAYTLVQGRRSRIALLRQLRTQTRARCPILISFYYRAGTPRVYRVAAFVANALRRVLRREPAEVGDWLVPNYVHYFAQHEIVAELAEGGFDTIHYSTTGYGHAVGMAI
jgi:hypothetical protein